MKIKILLASVLKPVYDTRMYYKLGASLKKIFQEGEILVLGFVSNPSKKVADTYPVFRFSRLSPQRLFAPWIFLYHLFRIKPDLLIVCTFELLLPAVFYKLVFRKKLIYDVQENYYANIIYLSIYPWWIKGLLARIVRGIEYLSSGFIDYYFLAEQCYTDELPFLKNNFLVLENKFLPIHPPHNALVKKENDQTVRYLISGTISLPYGIMEAIHYIEVLIRAGHPVRLDIVGHCPSESLFKELEKVVGDKEYIFLNISPEPIPYEVILDFMQEADIVLMPYQLNRSFQNRMPTKFYEAMYYQKKILLQHNKVWEVFFQQHGYPLSKLLDFKLEREFVQAHQNLLESSLQNKLGFDESILWAEEEEKMKIFFEYNNFKF